MTQRAVTAEEVARLAGVSQAAVSRTYTPRASVAAKTPTPHKCLNFKSKGVIDAYRLSVLSS